MDQEVVQFRQSHRRSTKGQQFKVRNSFGVYDCYKLIRKNHWYNLPRKVTEGEFYSIVRMVNNLLADNLALGIPVKLPSKMGMLELRKMDGGCSIVDGKLKIRYPIDWAETWKLWYEDAEACSQKLLKRDEQKYIYYTKYVKDKADYENKIFYQFVLNRGIKKTLKKNIKSGITDTLHYSETITKR